MRNEIELAKYELDKFIVEHPEGHIIHDLKEEILVLFKAFGKLETDDFDATQLISDTIKLLLRFQPLTPLTGEEDEWRLLSSSNEKLWQNKRDPGVFKNEEGECHYSYAIMFEDRTTGFVFTSTRLETDLGTLSSLREIKSFPFVPKPFYVGIRAESDGTFVVIDDISLQKANEYYQ